MPFREKAKQLFKTRSRSDSLSKTPTNSSQTSRPQSNVYAPGEPMPPLKYRRPPKKEHKESLEAFSFGDSWRKKSFQSTYSPMGTRVPSRRTSLLSFGRRKSVASVATSTGKSVNRTASVASIKETRLPPEPEQEGDDDVTNVGVSRIPTKDSAAPADSQTIEPDANPPPAANGHPTSNGLLRVTTQTAQDHQPFSEEDLVLALKRSHVQVPTQS